MKDLLNKYIIITKPILKLNKYSLSVVKLIDRDNIITDNFVIRSNQLDSVKVIENPLSDNSNVNVEDEVILNKSYNTKKAGEKIVIKGFLDNEKTKILTDGLAPGGWIDINQTHKDIDLSKMRMKSFFECCVEFGINFINTNFIPSYKLIKYLGMSLKSFDYVLSKDWISVGGSSVPGIYLTNETNEPKKYDIVVISKEQFIESQALYPSEIYSAQLSSLDKYFGKKLRDFPEHKDMNLRKTIESLNNHNYLTVNGIAIGYLLLELIEI